MFDKDTAGGAALPAGVANLLLQLLATARRAGVSASFERTVLAQADLQALCGAALRVTQQINQTDFWGQIFTHVGTTLDKTGPQHLSQL